jgi:gamma-glutamyl phosphate reductase
MSSNFYMEKIGKNAKFASNDLSNISIGKKNAVLLQFYKYLKIYSKNILKANKRDVLNAKKKVK